MQGAAAPGADGFCAVACQLKSEAAVQRNRLAFRVTPMGRFLKEIG